MESDSSLRWQGKGALEELLRERLRATIQGLIEEELVAALVRHDRSEAVRFELGFGMVSARER